MDRFTEEAVVLSTVDYADADRLVTLLTQGRGKLTAFAIGARKSRRRFAGALEPGTRLRAHLVERRGDTYRLDGVDLRASFRAVREDLALLSRALYAVELCRELTRDREPHPELYALLVEYLDSLDASDGGPGALIAFELDALAHAGLMPRFSSCASCQGPTGGQPRFDPEHGGVLCEACAKRHRLGVRVRAELIHALATLQREKRGPASSPLYRHARELLNLFIAHHLGKPLKSVEFMNQVGLD